MPGCDCAMCLCSGVSWELVYTGPALEHVCDGLKPGCCYQTRVYCMSVGGQSPVSHSASAHTGAAAPTSHTLHLKTQRHLFAPSVQTEQSGVCDAAPAGTRNKKRHRSTLHIIIQSRCKPDYCAVFSSHYTFISQLLYTVIVGLGRAGVTSPPVDLINFT